MTAQEYSWPQVRSFSSCAQCPIPSLSKPHSIPCLPVCSGRGYSHLCTVDGSLPHHRQIDWFLLLCHFHNVHSVMIAQSST